MWLLLNLSLMDGSFGMPQFQILTIGTFILSILFNVLVFGGTTFNVGITPLVAILFLLVSMGGIFWVFYTPSGKSFARKYNKDIAEKAYLTPEQKKLEKSRAAEFGLSGAVMGFIISIPSMWATLQMLNLSGGGSFAIGYIIGIVVIVFVGYVSGYSQGAIRFQVTCPNCRHKFEMFASASCPACGTGLYIDENGNCKGRINQ